MHNGPLVFKRKQDLVNWFDKQNPRTEISWRYYAGGEQHVTIEHVRRSFDVSQIKHWRRFHIFVESIAPNYAFGA